MIERTLRVGEDTVGWVELGPQLGPQRGPRIVVVPPLGMPAAVVAPFARALATHGHVCVVELPGAGRSSPLRGPIGTSDLGAMLAALLRAHATKSHLFGVSLGAMVAECAALEAPETIEKLVLASAVGRGRDLVIEAPLGLLAVVTRAFGGGLSRLAFAEAIVAEQTRDDTGEQRRIAAALEASQRSDAELPWLAAAAATHDSLERLPSLALETLVLSGGQDELMPVALQARVAGAIPNAIQTVFPRAGHALTLDQPERTADVVQRFLRP